MLWLTIEWYHFSEVVLGEHTLGTDPDCQDGETNCDYPKIIKRKVTKQIIHEEWNAANVENDIALLRLDAPVPLYDDQDGAAVSPVCLPWKNQENAPG